MIMIRKLLPMLAISMVLLSGSCLAVFDSSSFLRAAREGDIATIQTMATEASRQDKDLVLELAASKGHLAVVQFLLGMNISGHQLPADRIANINAENDEALRWAAESGHLAVIQFLLGMSVKGHQLPADRIANIHSADVFGNDALRLAVKNGHLAVVQFLIQQGADLSILPDQLRESIMALIYTPLIQALEQGDAVKIQTITATRGMRDQLLSLAAEKGNLEIVQLLLGMRVKGHQLPADKIAYIHAYFDAALRLAAENGHLAIVQFLLGMSIDGHQLPEARIADIHADNDQALRGAVLKGYLKIVQFLLGVNINGHQLPADKIANIHAENDAVFRLARDYAYPAIQEFLKVAPLAPFFATMDISAERQPRVAEEFAKYRLPAVATAPKETMILLLKAINSQLEPASAQSTTNVFFAGPHSWLTSQGWRLIEQYRQATRKLLLENPATKQPLLMRLPVKSIDALLRALYGDKYDID
ncbi:ankyrin repeat domain-containing protein, partial [Candidatus Dependentiae bacterium]|nr:ankyrin repeat domain-containing protein [Candidatus Dependentiae bacterium]